MWSHMWKKSYSYPWGVNWRLLNLFTVGIKPNTRLLALSFEVLAGKLIYSLAASLSSSGNKRWEFHAPSFSQPWEHFFCSVSSISFELWAAATGPDLSHSSKSQAFFGLFSLPRTVASCMSRNGVKLIGKAVLHLQWPCAPREIAGAILSLMMFYISKNLAPFDIKEWNVRCNCYCFLTFHRLIRPASGFPECGFVPKKRTGFLVKEFWQGGNQR